jgi:SAM-dependent methyltransferase
LPGGVIPAASIDGAAVGEAALDVAGFGAGCDPGRREMTAEIDPAIDPRRIVADGYDAIAERYFAWSDARPSATRRRWLARALELIRAGSDVLDLGCGAGVPMTRALAVGRRVTGVDISARQIELARAAVPEATFIRADMSALDLAPASLDAVVAFYSLTHVPRADLPRLLAAVRGWLRPTGILIASMGAQDAPDAVDADWLGVPMFFSHHGAKKNRALIRGAGFELEEAVVEEEPEDRHAALFLWVVARRPSGDADD